MRNPLGILLAPLGRNGKGLQRVWSAVMHGMLPPLPRQKLLSPSPFFLLSTHSRGFRSVEVGSTVQCFKISSVFNPYLHISLRGQTNKTVVQTEKAFRDSAQA